jgi:peptidoglycan/LPS O-acetylase OafA/YrhL
MKILGIEYSPKRIYGLDILRAFAILFVLISHGNYFLGRILPEKMLDLIVFDGVSIFFVLSGFLIGGILIKIINTEKNTFASLFIFWTRRWLRTLPAYFFVLLVLFLCYYLSHSVSPPKFWQFLIFSQNLAYPHPPFFIEAWSLSIEEWFYLSMPPMLYMLIYFGVSPQKSIPIIALSIIGFSMFMRFYYFSTHINSSHDIEKYIAHVVVTRLDSLMYGVLGAFIQYYYFSTWVKYKNSVFIIGLILLLAVRYSFSLKGILFSAVFTFTLNSIATLMLLPFLSELKSGKGLLFKFFTLTSIISYSLYLTNLSLVISNAVPFTMNFFAVGYGRRYYLFSFLLYWLFTIVFSYFIYKKIELPGMNLRDKINFKKKSV